MRDAWALITCGPCLVFLRDRVLARVGWVNVGLFAVRLAIAPFDHCVVVGIHPWIKPMKCAFSIAVHLWILRPRPIGLGRLFFPGVGCCVTMRRG